MMHLCRRRTNHPDEDGERRWLRSGAALLVALAGLALLMTACSLPGAAHQASSSSSPSPDPKNAGLEYARCMRSHGVPNFPDPDSSGGLVLPPNGSVDPNSPQFQSAQQACQDKVKSQFPPQAPPAQDREKLLRYAACMRSHGVPDFPDPRSDGALAIDASKVDPNSPQFKAADQACRQNLPGGGQNNTRTSGGGGS
jgi:hypothetical protein